ncbi:MULTISPECIES: hypothetical protein [Crocosphaera]|uniref:Uncharacterized protein n=6 Tax=Crocosphaera watsonii TaxID=263511 RepID=T2JM24_CROWT|nr:MULTISPECIES: hypothetical protein [Crocosphaera]EHJ13010.1 hypothetical protein CWATWH0003_2275 [Crocosphaera watsonii WH 0003]MCH2244768.1 hypothetical protein [Crocosphaera sp.]CCQ58634.1 Sll1389 protein [Crocosphaera watsonii WH 0005]CCQ66126.1 hypothetical protein CWATWH0402_2447 [Crocosphaera watsonii WH 0402]
MEDKEKQGKNEAIQREILAGRKFSLAEAIGREGGDFLKGESPVPKLVQATTEINTFIAINLQDSSGALQAVLQTWISTDEAGVSKNLDSPLTALKQMLDNIIDNSELLYELVRQVDFQWEKMYDERPYFQSPGQPPHPDDEYTHESVEEKLKSLLTKL